MANTHDIIGPLFAGIPDPSTVVLAFAFIAVVAVLGGMAVSLWAGRGH